MKNDTMKTTLGCLGGTLLLLAGPGLTIAGGVLMFSNPCFFRQFPPAYCNSSNNGPNPAGVILFVFGLLLLAVLFGLMAANETKRRRRDRR